VGGRGSLQIGIRAWEIALEWHSLACGWSRVVTNWYQSFSFKTKPEWAGKVQLKRIFTDD
jgi:hypothetical protein